MFKSFRAPTINHVRTIYTSKTRENEETNVLNGNKLLKYII